MSVLKKFFGLKKVDASEIKATYKRASPRLRPSKLNGLEFYRENSAEALRILNISTTGVGFDKLSWSDWPARGAFFDGEFLVGDERVKVCSEVMHISESLVGCRFKDPPPRLAELLRDRFKLEFSAVELVKIDPKLLKPAEEGEAQWFRGADASELYVVTRLDEVVSFFLVFQGFRVEGGKHPVRFSRLKRAAIKRAYDETLYEEVSASDELRALATRFLTSIESLNSEHRIRILEIIVGGDQ